MSEQPPTQKSERDISSVRRIARNTSFLTISQIISYGESFIYVILVARYLGPQGLGVLNFAVALTAIFSILANFGLTTLTTREVARDKSKASKYAANLIPMQLLFALIAIGLIVVLVNALGYSQQTIYVVYILSIGIITAHFRRLFLAIFQAFEQLEFQADSHGDKQYCAALWSRDRDTAAPERRSLCARLALSECSRVSVRLRDMRPEIFRTAS